MTSNLDTSAAKTASPTLWENISQNLKGSIDPESFELWLKPVRAIAFDNGCLTLGVPNRFFNDWILTHCKDKIQNHLRELAGPEAMVELVIFQDQHVAQ